MICSKLLIPVNATIVNLIQTMMTTATSTDSLGNPIGDRTWYGSIDDVNVSSFINHNEKDITIAFEIVQNVNEIIKYNFNMDVDFYRINTRPESEDAAAAAASRSNVQRITS